MLVDGSCFDQPAYCAALERARRIGRPVLASWTRPSLPLDAIGFFGEADRSEPRALWLRPGSGEALVGIGSARTLDGHGPARFAEIGAAWRGLLADAVVDDGGSGLGPRLLGGFSFDTLAERSNAWAGFADGRMVVPQRLLTSRDGAMWLTTSVVVRPQHEADADGRIRLRNLVDGRAVTAAADEPLSAEPESAEAWSSQPYLAEPESSKAWSSERLSAEAELAVGWRRLVGGVVEGIRQGRLGVEKVVLARAERGTMDPRRDVQHALRDLADGYPECTIFAFAQGEACFLGATPERLIALRQGLASTMALAGSGPRGVTPADDEALAQRLLCSPKERAEHAVVVGALRDGLTRGGLCTRIVADARPRVQKLANVQHLLTPIRAQVAAGTDVLSLVARLHPTPAVGGYPREAALRLIRDREGLDRGWYGGPIGWVDARGDGEFVVGIRSALVRDGQATLFAGCGIVAESDAAAEYAESTWKLRPMRAALGLDGERMSAMDRMSAMHRDERVSG